MEEKINEFLSIAPSASPEQARQLIEASKGDVSTAISQFFGDDDMGDDTADIPPPSPPKASNPSSAPSQKNEKPKSRIATFSDFQGDDHQHDHSDDEEGQEFFAGGKASGVAIQGPQTKARDYIDNIFKIAEESGRREREREGQPPAAPQPKKQKAFGGGGNRLGDGTEQEQSSSPAQSSSPVPRQQQQQQQQESATEEMSCVLTLWEDGFSVDDGPLRDYRDPANAEFLRDLSQGMVPRELKAKQDQPVNVSLQKRLSEKYIPPKKILKPFSGSGNRLGSEVPGEVMGGGSSSSSNSSPAPAASTPVATPQPTPMLANENEPLTTVQIRLADGTRLVAKFNPTQTVADVVRFINMSRSGESQRNYVLMTTFPNKELTNLSATLQEAGLLNAVVVQRYK